MMIIDPISAEDFEALCKANDVEYATMKGTLLVDLQIGTSLTITVNDNDIGRTLVACAIKWTVET